MATIPNELGQSLFSLEEILQRLQKLRYPWQLIDNQKIEYVFDFGSFKAALIFVNSIGEVAQQMNHHPDLHLLHNKVIVDLWTHSISGLSEIDFDLAQKIESVYGNNTESLIYKSMNDHIQDKLEQVKNDARQLGQHVSEVISSGGGKMIKEKMNTTVETMQTHGKKVDQMARENTWITAGIAALVGMIVGLFFSSRRRS